MPSPTCVIIDTPAATVWSDPAVPESLRRGIAANPGKLIQAAACRPVKISQESLIVEASGRSAIDRCRWPSSNTARAHFGKPWPRSFDRPRRCRTGERPSSCSRTRLPPRGRCLPAAPRGWTTSSTSFLVTQWIGGAENLHLFGWRIAARPLAARLRLAARCAAALGRLLGRMHAAGAAHRDLKAANLLVVEEGRDVIVYLVDLDGLQPGKPARFPATGPRSGALGGRTGRASLGHAVDLPAFSPRVPGGVSRGRPRLEAVVAGNRRGNRRAPPPQAEARPAGAVEFVT